MNIISDRWTALEEARLALAKFPRRAEELDRALERLASFGRRVLGTERVSIWDIDFEAERLVRRALADEKQDDLREVPLASAYARGIGEMRVLAIHDVEQHPMAAPLLETYCRPLGIVSLMDVPVYAGGDIIGLVCHERRGATHTWTDVEADLGLAIAEVVSALRTEHAARAAESAVREREAQVAELSKRAALARVAKGLAHDLNNLFGVVQNAAALIESNLHDAAVLREVASNLRDVIRSARGLSDELDRAAGSETVPEPLLVDDSLRELTGTLSALAGEGRSFTVSLGAEGAAVRLTRAAFEQVMMNLVVNAREATKPGDRIDLRTLRQPASAQSGGADLLLEVQDSGHGMDAQTQASLFVGPYSTKGARRGLGLPNVKRIVELAGGWIEVCSHVGEGSTFRIHLPLEK